VLDYESPAYPSSQASFSPNMSDKPVVLVTRKLPAAVEDRLRRDYQPIL